MDAIFYLYGEAEMRHQMIFVFVHADMRDIGIGLTDLGGDARQDAFFILCQ